MQKSHQMNQNKNIYNIKGKNILITGASGLIGSHITQTFLSQGCNLALLDYGKENIVELKSKLNNFSKRNYDLYNVDISKQDELKKCIKSIYKKLGTIDSVIHLAAINPSYNKIKNKYPEFHEFPFENWKKSIEVNINGTFFLTKLIIGHCITNQTSCSIILVGSTYSTVSSNYNLYLNDEKVHNKPADYVATKSMIPNFTKYLATNYAKNDIRVNCLILHGIEDNQPEWFKNNFAKLSPIKRLCNLTEVDGAFLFLASDLSSYTTGTTLKVDGGWTAW